MVRNMLKILKIEESFGKGGWDNWIKVEKKKGETEDEMVGWHHWLSGHELQQTPGDSEGQGSLACCSPWGGKESDMTERLNWTEQVQRHSITFSCTLHIADSWIALVPIGVHTRDVNPASRTEDALAAVLATIHLPSPCLQKALPDLPLSNRIPIVWFTLPFNKSLQSS